MALNIYTGSLGDTSRGSRYRNQALSAHPPNQIKRPSKQGQIVAGALARPTAFLGGCKKLPLSIPSITKPSALMVWCLLGCSGLFCGNLNSFAGKGECFFGGGPQAWAEFLWTTQSHRSHFGSRYTLGCCGHASPFRRRFEPAQEHFSDEAVTGLDRAIGHHPPCALHKGPSRSWFQLGWREQDGVCEVGHTGI